jgi:gamma-glutamylcyclotransferase (GGCT)/AIG2-like uncharacterized protein YtfP
MVDKLHTPEENVTLESNEKIRLFVYGALMKGNSNHENFLSNARFAGYFIADGFQIYDFGSYPLIAQNEIDKVRGEMYIVDNDLLCRLDISEAKANLFTRKSIKVVNEIDNDDVQEAYIYVYNKDLSNNIKVSCDNQPKVAVERKDYIWYATYGSNLIYERLLVYIKGGKSKFNGVEYEGCRNKSIPKDTRPVAIPYKMYYGNESSPWGPGGIAFLDTQSRGQTLGRMYLVTGEQFEDISRQEGREEDWYNQTISLGDYNGVEIVTITNKNTRAYHNPCDNYLEVIRIGVKETYPEMSDFEVMKYLVEGELIKK